LRILHSRRDFFDRIHEGGVPLGNRLNLSLRALRC
jgi:hypothetical protein